MRCTITGTASAPRPTRNAGVRKDIGRLLAAVRGSSYAHQLLAAREITEQRPVERLVRSHECVVDPLFGKLRRQRVDVFPNQPPVFLAERIGYDRNLLAALEIFEARRLVVSE